MILGGIDFVGTNPSWESFQPRKKQYNTLFGAAGVVKSNAFNLGFAKDNHAFLYMSWKDIVKN